MELARETAYPGYDKFTPDKPMENTRVDFDWEDGPTESQVKNYYSSYKGSASNIYRWGLDSEAKQRAAAYQEALKKHSALFSMGKTEAYVGLENSFLSKSVRAELRYVIPTPGILRFVGVRDDITIYAAAYQPVMNTTDFVRNIDLAWDMGRFLLGKLGMEGQAEKFSQAFDKVTDILF